MKVSQGLLAVSCKGVDETIRGQEDHVWLLAGTPRPPRGHADARSLTEPMQGRGLNTSTLAKAVPLGLARGDLVTWKGRRCKVTWWPPRGLWVLVDVRSYIRGGLSSNGLYSEG